MNREDRTGSDDVVIASIVKARGIRGEVSCRIETDFPERFETLEEVTVKMPGGERLRLGLENHWFHKDRLILKFQGYDTMSDAERLQGGKLVIPESEGMQLEEDEFYEYDLVGLDVYVEDRIIGKVTGLMRTTGTDLLVVEGPDSREILIPFADEVCPEVDLESGRLTVSPPEGLLDL